MGDPPPPDRPSRPRSAPATPPAGKSAGAFRTIGEVSADTGLPQHVLRYWEQRFPQLRPLQRAGNRRYYRPEDVALVERIDRLLNHEGYTVRGVQQLLRRQDAAAPAPPAVPAAPSSVPGPAAGVDAGAGLARIRTLLVAALAADG